HVTTFAMNNDTNTVPFSFVIGGESVHVASAPAPVGLTRFVLGQPAHFEDQRCLLVIVVNDERIRGLPVVLVAKASTRAPDPRRQLAFAKKPSGDVHLMYGLVADVAVANVPVPMPVIVKTLSPNGLRRPRAAPEIVIHVRRRRLRSGDLA